ncbi:MAG: hypothetical protein L6Q31_08575 [Fimbriimonadaceae bacterium]|nr:hypothetical protein [Fimbriimonadaceae bacterium]
MSAMVETLSKPILGLDSEFPDVVYVSFHSASGKYGCYCHLGIHGLACFSSEAAAIRFTEWIDLSGMTVVELTFDEAREVAKARPFPVVALMLLDRMDQPKIHYVR